MIAWLKMLENQSAQQRPEDPMGAYNFTWLWRELGVGDITVGHGDDRGLLQRQYVIEV